MLRLMTSVIQRDLCLAWRKRAELISTLSFFALVICLFPLAVGADSKLLRTIAPGVVWVAALLASTLTLPRLFAPDYADGVLEQMLLSSEPFTLLVLGKIIAHWLVSALPLILCAPILALQLGLPAQQMGILLASLLLGTASLSLFGALGAALTLGLRGAGMLQSLVVLPLTVPVLVFGANAVQADAASSSANLLLLAGVFAAALALMPWAISAALRISAE